MGLQNILTFEGKSVTIIELHFHKQVRNIEFHIQITLEFVSTYCVAART